MPLIKDKLAICYTCFGETFRESTINKLQNSYINDENLYYFILTDDKKYFKNIKRKNLIVNEIKDFYKEYPHIEEYEPIIEAKDKNEYAKIFTDKNYLFPFSLMRFHFLQAIEYNINNISLTCTDTKINLDFLPLIELEPNTIINTISEWDENTSKFGMNIISDFLKKEYNHQIDQKVRVLDAAARIFCFKDIKQAKDFFDVWDRVMLYLYESDQINIFKGSYVINDEYILAPIYRMFKLNNKHCHSCSSHRLFEVKHNVKKERFWKTLGYDGLQEHTNYEEFLKLNNLNNG
tara:strand:+ start:19198 stop:20073 length:876 start_codon:yes stop_codon:yes gene_type:complete